jgi:hypothetical protein
MKRSEIEHVLRAAKGIAGEDEFILIGSRSVLGAFPDAPWRCAGPSNWTSIRSNIPKSQT